MSLKARELAGRFEQVNNDFIRYIGNLTPEEWRAYCPNEDRTVAALAFHVAGGYLFELRSFKAIADGQPLPAIEKESLDRSNAENGAKRADGDRDEALRLLAENGAIAAEFVGGLSDEELERGGAYLEWMPAMSVEQWIDRVLIGHIQMHLASIRDALATQSSTSS